MSIKNIINVFFQIRDMGIRDFSTEKAEQLTSTLACEVTDAVEMAEKILLERIPEKDLVVLMLAIQKASAAEAAARGEGTSLIMAEITGELQSYTHTVILATIGCLVQDEIL